MKAVLQRVSEASVAVDGRVVGATGPGLLILLCAEGGDGEAEVEFLARKITNLRVFADEAGERADGSLHIRCLPRLCSTSASSL